MRAPPPFISALLIALAVGSLFVIWIRTEPSRHLSARESQWGAKIEVGDLVFQDLDCGLRCELIRIATHSHYSQVGIVLDDGGKRVVWEAFRPVGPVPLTEWVQRGRSEKLALYRFRDDVRAQLPAIDREIRKMQGLPNDADFQWRDDKVYSSEMIEKAYERALGTPLVAPHALGAGSLGDKADLIYRVTNHLLTEDTLLVTPIDLTRAPVVVKVVDELASS